MLESFYEHGALVRYQERSRVTVTFEVELKRGALSFPGKLETVSQKNAVELLHHNKLKSTLSDADQQPEQIRLSGLVV